jgi:DUF218 domain
VVAPLVIVSGGSRAVPDGSEFAAEADAIPDVLLRREVPENVLVLERLAANTSENFWLSAELLRDLGLDPQTFLVAHKPYAERRTLATARRRWPSMPVAVTSQQVGFDDYCAGEIPVSRILSMLAGEALHLDAYAASGLIHLDEPVRRPARRSTCAASGRVQQPGHSAQLRLSPAPHAERLTCYSETAARAMTVRHL